MYLPVWIFYSVVCGSILSLYLHANTINSIHELMGAKKKINTEFIIGCVFKFILALASLLVPIYLMYERL